MSEYQGTFKRYEKKYLVTQEQYSALALLPAMVQVIILLVNGNLDIVCGRVPQTKEAL